MLLNYLRLAVRNLRKHRIPAAINIIGLAVGVACCMLLFLYVSFETSWDSFHADAENIYRITYHTEEPSGDTSHRAQTPPLLLEQLVGRYADIEAGVRVGRRQLRVSSASLTTEMQSVEFADAEIFDIFSFHLARGSEHLALAAPEDAVLSPAAADLYFPGQDPVGQTLTVEFETGKVDFSVAAVLEEIPTNSSLKFEVLLPFAHYRNTYSGFLRDAVFESGSMKLPVVESYVKLASGADLAAMRADFPEFLRSYLGEENTSRADLQPLGSVHLNPAVTNGLEPTGNPLYSWLLGAAALLILAVACINYVTLSLGRSLERAREVGIRKSVGARPEQIRNQFWGETIVVSAIAFLGGVMLAELALPTFNAMTGVELELDLTGRGDLWLIGIGLVTVVSICSGLYPAVVLSRFDPVRVLKGQSVAVGRRVFTRILVTVQFAISIALVAGMLVIDRQLEYLLDADLGFDSDRIVVMKTSGTDNTETLVEGLRQTAESDPDIQSFTASFFSFGTPGLNLQLAADTDGGQITAQLNPVADNYVEAMGLTLVAGQSLSGRTGERSVIVNRMLVEQLGWDSAVGRELPVHEEGYFGDVVRGMTIAGVVEDYNLVSMHESIEPVVLAPISTMGGGAMVATARIRDGSEAAVLPVLRDTWMRLAPEKPFSYEFLQDVVANQYTEEARWRSIIGWAGGMAVLLASFGLVGLALLSTRRRIREIGIRKVLGASTPSLLVLLSSEYALYLLTASVIALPVAWLATQAWLDNFAFRAEIGVEVYVAAGLGTLVVALATTSLQVIRAASADPVDSLRTE